MGWQLRRRRAVLAGQVAWLSAAAGVAVRLRIAGLELGLRCRQPDTQRCVLARHPAELISATSSSLRGVPSGLVVSYTVPPSKPTTRRTSSASSAMLTSWPTPKSRGCWCALTHQNCYPIRSVLSHCFCCERHDAGPAAVRPKPQRDCGSGHHGRSADRRSRYLRPAHPSECPLD